MVAQHTKQTEQDGKDTELILYRLGVVEGAVKDVSSKLDKQDTIKKADLQDFKQFITDRMVEFRQGLQSQIDSNRTYFEKLISELSEDKASKQELRDLKKQVYAIVGFEATLALALISYLLSKV